MCVCLVELTRNRKTTTTTATTTTTTTATVLLPGFTGFLLLFIFSFRSGRMLAKASINQVQKENEWLPFLFFILFLHIFFFAGLFPFF